MVLISKVIFSTLAMAIAFDMSRAASASFNPVEAGREARLRWSYLMAGWRAEREKLKSYKVQISGHEEGYTQKDIGKVKNHIPYNSTYKNIIFLNVCRDFTRSKAKYEIRWGHGVHSAGSWITTNEQIIEFANSGSPIVTFNKPGDKRQQFAIKFQPECIGLLGAGDFRYNEEYAQIPEAHKFFSEALTLLSLSQLGEGRNEATLAIKVNGSYKINKLVINESRGFSIESNAYLETDRPDGPAPPLHGEIRVTWVKQGDLWLPSKLTEDRTIGLSTVELAFDWTAVNTPIADREFEIDSLGVPKGTLIVDQRLGREKTIVLGHTGAPIEISPSPPAGGSLRTSTMVIVGVGTFLAILGCLALLVRWRRGRS